MNWQEIVALAIVAAAAGWLVLRWRRGDATDGDEAAGCGSCHHAPGATESRDEDSLKTRGGGALRRP